MAVGGCRRFRGAFPGFVLPEMVRLPPEGLGGRGLLRQRPLCRMKSGSPPPLERGRPFSGKPTATFRNEPCEPC